MGNIAQIHAYVIIGDNLPLLPPGEYTFQFVSYSTWMMFGRSPKLILEFVITDKEIYRGVKLNKYYNVKKLKGRHGKNGTFTVSRKSDFMRDLFRICPAYPPKRLDRIPMSRFEGIDIRGQVKTVTKGHDQKDIPEPLQYSVIKEINPC